MDCPGRSRAELGAAAGAAALTSCVVLCVALDCDSMLALVTLRLELEAAWRFQAEVEVGQAEMLKQGEQVGQQEGARAQGQQEMTQR